MGIKTVQIVFDLFLITNNYIYNRPTNKTIDIVTITIKIKVLLIQFFISLIIKNNEISFNSTTIGAQILLNKIF